MYCSWMQGKPYKGKWGADFFKNDHPIVLELACGKGEYTVSLGQLFPQKNFIGIDYKGNRIWRGAKTALDENVTNVGFLRIQIDNYWTTLAKMRSTRSGSPSPIRSRN